MWFLNSPHPSAARPACVNSWAKIRLIGVALLVGGAAHGIAHGIEVHPQTLTSLQWPQHANGKNIADLPAVRHALRLFAEDDNITIVIEHPGGDRGELWANQLYRWLITLGVPTRYLSLEPGAGAVDQLVVSVIDWK